LAKGVKGNLPGAATVRGGGPVRGASYTLLRRPDLQEISGSGAGGPTAQERVARGEGRRRQLNENRPARVDDYGPL
jgi:hypothetical protein